MAELTSPRRFGDYLLVELIASGGMAQVYRALTFGVEGFSRQVAIKRMLPGLAKNKSFIDMLIDEARIVVQLNDTHIVQTFELGEVEGQYYIAMEYVAGLDLERLLTDSTERHETLPVPLAAYIVSAVCSGLDHAHRKASLDGKPLNIVHRDVSPQNVLIGFSGEVKVTDFGIARAEDRLTQTHAGTLKGKFAYMAPEQVRATEVTRAADIFVIGALLFEVLTGHPMFEADDDFSVLEAVRNGAVRLPRQLRPDLPEELDAIVAKATATAPDDRYAFASEIGEALEPFLIDGRTIVGSKAMEKYLAQRYEDEIATERVRPDTVQPEVPIEVTEDDLPTAEEWQVNTLVVAAQGVWEHPSRRPTAKDIEAIEATWGARERVDTEPQPALLAGETQPFKPLHDTEPSHPPPLLVPEPKSSRWPAFVVVFVLLGGAAVAGGWWLARSGTLPHGGGKAPPPAEDATRPESVADGGQTGGESVSKPGPGKSPGVASPLAEPANPKAELAALRRMLDKLARRHGVIAGDIPELDAQRAKVNSSIKQGHTAAAALAASRGVAILKRFSPSEEFIHRKLARFNRHFDKTKNASLRAKLSEHAERIGVAMGDGDLRGTNRELNAAFKAIRSGR